MSKNSRHLAFAAAFAVSLLPGTRAQAQWYSSVNTQPAPAYAYGVQQPYAVEVAPNTYVIHRSNGINSDPFVSRRAHRSPPVADAPVSERPRTHADRALIEELRERAQRKSKTIDTVKIVRDPPVVIEHKRYVDDPPRIIERKHVVGDEPALPPPPPVQAPRRKSAEARSIAPRNHGDEKRVIRADAEITIIGPDRMSIRLFRKGHGANANAEAE
jgi:hypothetical protein